MVFVRRWWHENVVSALTQHVVYLSTVVSVDVAVLVIAAVAADAAAVAAIVPGVASVVLAVPGVS